MGAWDDLKEMVDAEEAKTKALEERYNMPPGLLAQAQAMGSMGLTTKNKIPFQAYEAMVRLKPKNGSTIDEFFDAIRGLNKGHALYRAKDNWQAYEPEIVGRIISPKPSGKLKY